MDTNKIREALDLASKALKAGNTVSPNDMWRAAAAVKEAIAELDKAPKVLTDEIDAAIRIIRDGYCASSYQSYGVLRYSCCGGDFDNREHKYHCDAQAVLKRLEFARDNGYLAPAAGLTVEEIVRTAGDWFNHVVLDMSAGDDAASDLRTRLTAAIQAKQ